MKKNSAQKVTKNKRDLKFAHNTTRCEGKIEHKEYFNAIGGS